MCKDKVTLSTGEKTPTRQKSLPSLSLAQTDSLQGYFPLVGALTQPFRQSNLLAALCAVRISKPVRGKPVYSSLDLAQA
jgi:hypothetical protein